MAEYAPEVVYVAKIDRPNLISGWDIPGSLARVEEINTRLHRGAIETAPPPKKIFTGQPDHSHDAGEVGDDDNKFGATNFIVDSTTEVLLERMQNIARLIGVVSLLVALPLLVDGVGAGGQSCGPPDAERAPDARSDAAAWNFRPPHGPGAPHQRLARRAGRRASRAGDGVGGAAAGVRARPSAAGRAVRRPSDGDLRRLPADLCRAGADRQPPPGEVRHDDLPAGSVGPCVRIRGIDRVATIRLPAGGRGRARHLRAAWMELRFRHLGSAVDGLVPSRRPAARLPWVTAVSLRRRDTARLEAGAHPARDGAGAHPDRGSPRPLRAAPHVGETAPDGRLPADRGADVQRQPVSDRHQPVVRGQSGARREGADWRRLAGALQRAGPHRRRPPERAGRNADCGDQAGDRQADRVAQADQRCAGRDLHGRVDPADVLPSRLRAARRPAVPPQQSGDVPGERLCGTERRPERLVQRHHGPDRAWGCRGVAACRGLLEAGYRNAAPARTRRRAARHGHEYRRHPRVSSRDPAEERERSAGLRAGAHRLPELPVQHECLHGHRDRQRRS